MVSESRSPAFRWNPWNIDHISKHGVAPSEAEDVVCSTKEPFPWAIDDDKYIVWGKSRDGRLLQVVFVIDPDDLVYVIHARELTAKECQQFPPEASRGN
jgi:uncharacterized protein